MGEIKEFLKTKRKTTAYRPVCQRVKDYREVNLVPQPGHSREQAGRCMDCGTPFCHWGCPVGNFIPEWNDLVFSGHWEKAFSILDATNNLPEITGRICPGLCEYSCVLGINDDPVTIRENELSIIERAFKRGLIRPRIPKKRNGKKIAIIGSGPAGLSCADQLNRSGNLVEIFEQDDRIGGVMRYGIPDFKLEKTILDRRIAIWEKEGIKFRSGVNIPGDISAERLIKQYDAVCLACGSRVPRDLAIPGRDLKGVHFAMEYLVQANQRIAKKEIDPLEIIDARGKKVVVIGGGDTGADCVGTAHRQGAACVVQIEIMPRPTEYRTEDYPWPKYPLLLKNSTSHQEGGSRQWLVSTKEFIGKNGFLNKISCAKVEFIRDDKGCPLIKELSGGHFEIEADLVILALGFLHPQKEGLLTELKLGLDPRGNVKTNGSFMTSRKKVFACGDMRRGQSLIVWAVSEGRQAAYHIDNFLTGHSYLPLI